MAHFFLPHGSTVFPSLFPDIRYGHKIKIELLIMIHETGDMGTTVAVRETNHSYPYPVISTYDSIVTGGSPRCVNSKDTCSCKCCLLNKFPAGIFHTAWRC